MSKHPNYRLLKYKIGEREKKFRKIPHKKEGGFVTCALERTLKRPLLKGNPSGDTNRPENLGHVQMFPFADIEWFVLSMFMPQTYSIASSLSC